MSSLLAQAVGEKRAATMLNEQPPTKASFGSLAVMSAEQVAGILSREQAGVIAMVLRFMPGPLGAEILDILPSEIRRRVIVFMCTAEPPSEEIVARVESLINAKTGPSKKSKKGGDVDKLDAVTAIIQHAKRSVEEDLLGAIQEKSEALATEIRDRLFTFEDVVRLSDIAMRRVMQEIDMGVLAIALRNATPELRDKFFRNMSKRAGEALREEMEFSQKVRLTDVEAKQREIVNVIRTLAADGQISLSGEDEYV
jgi:flagellar motor switch protein FliG